MTEVVQIDRLLLLALSGIYLQYAHDLIIVTVQMARVIAVQTANATAPAKGPAQLTITIHINIRPVFLNFRLHFAVIIFHYNLALVYNFNFWLHRVLHIRKLY